MNGSSTGNAGNTDAPRVRVGDVVAEKYRIERLIDEGGMGVVFEATHLLLEERVALKFLRGEVQGMDGFVDRFAQEARAAVKLKSEHVGRVLDVGTEPGVGPYMVMEYLEGQDLRTLLEQIGRTGTSEAVEYIIQACEGVAEAHARGIIHRDIKPANLFLVERSDDWRIIKVVDFGISKLRDALNDVDHGKETVPIMGSPWYMSPEQLISTKDVDHRTDIWSLGAVLFELLAGVPPYDPDGTLQDIIATVTEQPPKQLRELARKLPNGLEGVIYRCLEKDPARRFQNAAELAVALLPYAPRRARVPVERAIAVTRAGGLLTDPATALPPSFPPRPSPATSEAITLPAPPLPKVEADGAANAAGAARTDTDTLNLPFAHTSTNPQLGVEARKRRKLVWAVIGAVATASAIAAVAVSRSPSASDGPATAPRPADPTALVTAVPTEPPATAAPATTPSSVPASDASAAPKATSKPARRAPAAPTPAHTAAPGNPDLDIRKTR